MSDRGSAPPKSHTSRPLIPSFELGRTSSQADEYPCVSRRVMSHRPNISDSAAEVPGAMAFSNAITMTRERRTRVRKPVFCLDVTFDRNKPFRSFSVMLSCVSWAPLVCPLWEQGLGGSGHRLNSLSYVGIQSLGLKDISIFVGMSVIR